MKIPPFRITSPAAARRRVRARAFSFTEMMIASSLMTLLILGVVTANLFGIRLYEITRLKLGASDESRMAISKIVDEIRSAKMVKVGEGGLASFIEDPDATIQQGRALQIYATTNTNSFVRYFWDSADRRLKRTTNGSSAFSVVANSISNQFVFTVEDHMGNIVTNNQNNRVIGLTLQYYQLAYPVVNIPGPMFEYYQLRTKITRRVLE